MKLKDFVPNTGLIQFVENNVEIVLAILMKIAQKNILFATMAMALATNATQMKIAQKKVLFATVMDRATLATIHMEHFLPLPVTIMRAHIIGVKMIGLQNRVKGHAVCVI